MPLACGLAAVVALHLLALVLPSTGAHIASAEEERVQLSASGTVRRAGVSRRRHFARAEEGSGGLQTRASAFFSPLQLAAEVGPSPAPPGDALPWPVRPLCQFEADGNFDSLVRVFVNTDNTRAFVFDQDAKGAQTKVMCHGATPGVCTAPPRLSNGSPQSCADLRCECVQVTLSRDTILLNYVRQMLDKVGPLCLPRGGASILNIGLGGGAMPAYLLDSCARGTRVTSVERDPRVVAMAERFFGFRAEPGRNEVETLDALAAVQRHAGAGDRYDAVLVDCFEARGRVPATCRSLEFLQGVHKTLKPNGTVIQQVWLSQYSELYHMYNRVFGHEHVSVEPVDAGLNFLIIAKAPEG